MTAYRHSLATDMLLSASFLCRYEITMLFSLRTQVVLFLAFRTLTPLPTSTANVVPAPDSRVPLRPPGAFAKRKDLTAKACTLGCYPVLPRACLPRASRAAGCFETITFPNPYG